MFGEQPGEDSGSVEYYTCSLACHGQLSGCSRRPEAGGKTGGKRREADSQSVHQFNLFDVVPPKCLVIDSDEIQLKNPRANLLKYTLT